MTAKGTTEGASVTAVTDAPSAALGREQLLEMYYYVRLTRDVEERLTMLFRQNKVVGGLYRSLGQEGESVATAYALDVRDAVSPLIRNLGAILTRGVRPRDVFAQYMARGESPTRGRDLQFHFSHLPADGADEPTIIGPVSPLGDLVPIMGGIALGARLRKMPLVAMVYVGDGATSTGAFHEGINFAAVQKLPLVIVAEDNKFAYSTPISKQMAVQRIDQRADSYGVAHEMVDGNDILAVYDVAKRAVDRARAGAGPFLIGVDTMRMQGHAQHDDMRYVPRELLERWKTRDPIALYRARLLEMAVASDAELADVDRMSRSYADEEARLAEESPMPDPATVADGVYAGEGGFAACVEIVPSPFRPRDTPGRDAGRY